MCVCVFVFVVSGKYVSKGGCSLMQSLPSSLPPPFHFVVVPKKAES